jgi:hypothetical protein
MTWTPLAISTPSSNAAAAAAGLTLIAVDPWTHGVAAGDGSNTNLSFPNAVQAVVDKLTGISGAGLAIAVAAASAGGLAAELNTLAASFPLPNLERLARRAGKMAALELSKFNLVPPMRQPSGLSINAMPPIRALQRADLIKAAYDNAESFKSSNPNDNMTAFQSERAAHTAAVSTVQSEAASGLSGGTGWRFYAANNVASNIASGFPGHEYTMTAIMLFVGEAADLALLTEIFPPP